MESGTWAAPVSRHVPPWVHAVVHKMVHMGFFGKTRPSRLDRRRPPAGDAARLVKAVRQGRVGGGGDGDPAEREKAGIRRGKDRESAVA